jgi:SagB-type dehydrogenase family enzyme
MANSADAEGIERVKSVHMLASARLPSAGAHPQVYRPRISHDVVFIEMEEGVLVDGLGRVQVIRGPLAQTILPRLIKLMDGTRNLAELGAAFPAIPERNIYDAIALLTEWNLMDDDRDCVAHTGANTETIAFLKRRIANSNGRYSVFEAYDGLQSAHVVIVASADSRRQADYILLLLERSGVGSATTVSQDTFRTTDVPQGGLVLALGINGNSHEWFEALETQKFAQGFSWMRCTLDESAGFADVGPVFQRGKPCCYDCFCAVHGGPAGKSDPRPAATDASSIWASFVGIEVLNLLALPPLALGPREFRRFHLPEWHSQVLKYPRLLGCQVCRPETFCKRIKTEDQRVTDIALVFEEYVGLESRSLLSMGNTENAAQDGAILNQGKKVLPNCEQIPLSEAKISLDLGMFDALRSRGSGDRFSVDDLAIILALTAGIRETNGEQSRRWAATAGNLGSVELFVVADDVDGLEPGVYFYQSYEHQLARLRRQGRMTSQEFMRRTLRCGGATLPNALVVFTAAFYRLIPKYGSFGYRLINLDAGACISQLHLTARCLNIWSQTVTKWPDDLIERELNVRSPGELCTAVVELSRRRRKDRKLFSFLGRSLPELERWASVRTPNQLRGLSVAELTELLVKESRSKEDNFHFRAREVGLEGVEQGSVSCVDVKFPHPFKGGAAVGVVFGKRRSVRVFDKSSVPMTDVGTALYYANRADFEEWPDEHRIGLPLIFLLLANRVAGLNAGVYEYKPRRHGLTHIARGLSREETSELLVQPEFADAGFIIWIAGDLAAACARYGAYGHRRLLLRAGAAGHRLWMGALGFGLSGSLVAGLIPGRARTLLRLDGYRRASLFAVAAGRSSERGLGQEMIQNELRNQGKDEHKELRY